MGFYESVRDDTGDCLKYLTQEVASTVTAFGGCHAMHESLAKEIPSFHADKVKITVTGNTAAIHDPSVTDKDDQEDDQDLNAFKQNGVWKLGAS
jgi:hypothetical protein